MDEVKSLLKDINHTGIHDRYEYYYRFCYYNLYLNDRDNFDKIFQDSMKEIINQNYTLNTALAIRDIFHFGYRSSSDMAIKYHRFLKIIKFRDGMTKVNKMYRDRCQRVIAKAWNRYWMEPKQSADGTIKVPCCDYYYGQYNKSIQ